jgi:succinoglycan biosynthesis transport protein ExoP
MQDQSITPIKIRTAFYIFKRHKWKLLTIFLSTVIIVTVVSLLATPIYRASAQLLVKPGREDVYVSPTASSPDVIDNSWEGQKVKAEISIITSLDLAIQLVDRVGVKRLFDYPTLYGRIFNRDSKPEIPSMEKVYKIIRQDLKATGESRSNVLNITFDWPDPVIAAETVNTLLDLYLAQHLKVHTNPKTYYLLDEQAKRWERKLKESEKELETFKRLNSITSLSEQRSLLLERLSDAAAQQRQTEGEIQETRAMVLALGRQLSKLQQNVQLQETVDQNSATLAALKARLADLELQGLKEEIEQVKKMIAEEEKRQGKVVTSGRSPIRQRLESDLLQAKARLKALEAKLKNQEIQVAKYKEEIDSLDALEKKLHELERMVSLNEGNYKLYLAKFEETNISESMDKENIANVRIIQHAVPIMKPIKPRKRLNVMIGGFVGLVIGVTVVLVLELINPVFHTREDVQQFLNVPVLAILPKLQAQSDKQPPTAKRKLKRLLSKYLKLAA